MAVVSDQQKFETLLAPLLDSAYGAAMHLSHNRDEAEDIVQEAALQAFRAFASFQEGTNFKAWFFRILTNVFLNRYRKKRREPVNSLEEAPDLYLYTQAKNAGFDTLNDDPAAFILNKLDSERIRLAIQSLPEDYRLVCTLHFIEDFSYQEIADMIGIPIGTVRSRLHRGRKMLQKALWPIAQEYGITDNPLGANVA